ncbi:hypothetical protein H2200_002793 [Cladophialophora chaetospira]|uniref:Glycosyl transferase CAP10 domain-containing protein n=1 Tax=Cladophialophora chaetospira TaxID=386627 RepID=A0AA38XJM6_9EURO|nr:hypothetical protein H2200_002793 [Cladophialophora chaetospira]
MLGSILRRREAKAVRLTFIVGLIGVFIFSVRRGVQPLQNVRVFDTSISTQSSGTDPAAACPPHPGAADVLVIIKTGATEASARIPPIFSTFAQCIPNVVIFSDLKQHLDGREIHDAPESVSAEYHRTSPEFDFYRRVREIHEARKDVRAFGKLEGNGVKAWTLDKWKNIPILHEAYRLNPHVKWYVFIDADTFLGFHNLVSTLEKLNHTLPLYMGAANTYGGDFIFAYGGAGYIVSAGAAALFEKAYTKENVEKWEAQTNVTCCGDVMLGVAMKVAGVRLRNAAPLMQPTSIGALEWNSRLWCEPSWTWHHIEPLEVKQLSEFDRKWHTANQAPYRFKDLFEALIEPGLFSIKEDWDNLSTDRVLVKPGGADTEDGYGRNQQGPATNRTLWDHASPGQKNRVGTPSDCQAACLEDQGCVQWVWKLGGSCGHHYSLRLGYQSNTYESRASESKSDVVSGWVLDRTRRLVESWNQASCHSRMSKLPVPDQTNYGELHPIETLVEKAQMHFNTMVRTQSKTLSEAVATYSSRYGRDPPSGFDKWFKMAKDAEYVLIDEFDTMMDSLEPFWGIAPSMLRESVDLIGETAPATVRIRIENHQVKDKASHKEIWQAETIDRWLEKPGWLEMLPDMILLVNFLDEPRVVAPSETLLAARQAAKSNAPDRKFIQNTSNASWVDLARTEAWRAMLSACPDDSPARNEMLWQAMLDNEQSLSLPFVDNLTSSQDICQNPLVARSHGFFTSPASCSVIQSLVPIFSAAKPSLFNDILYPAIWYWIKLLTEDYVENDDMVWSEKQDILYWTGSATGGYATSENWADLHRQRLILQTTKGNASARILHRTTEGNVWGPRLIARSSISHLFDLRITSVPSGQCTPEACTAMRNAFLKDPTYINHTSSQDTNADPLKTAYAAKYVLDLDGNAFSGRFYRLLTSQSAVLKQSIFKEWHDGRLVPWVHFIPISASGAELAETVRFLTQEEAGQEIGKRIASQGREWARRTLRMVDLELTYLRVLMEYGRLFDEGRDEFTGTSE